MPSGLLTDRALSCRLERAEGLAGARFVETRARLLPDSGAEWVEIAGTQPARLSACGVDQRHVSAARLWATGCCPRKAAGESTAGGSRWGGPGGAKPPPAPGGATKN